MKLSDCMAAALEVASGSQNVDGDHHKQWLIDQMVRCLMCCPTVLKTAIDCNGKEYSFDGLGESPEYLKWVAMQDEWDCGIPP